MEKEKQMETEDLTGQRFSRLTVIKRDEDRVDKRGRHTAMWVCKCECGTVKTVAGGHLKAVIQSLVNAGVKETTEEADWTT